MKRIFFVLVSAFFAVTAFCSNVTERVTTAVFNEGETKIEQKQNQPLILKKAGDFDNEKFSAHRSHYSHSSHRSHYSHYSSR